MKSLSIPDYFTEKETKSKKGTLYWITGLSGAGKTTIGNRRNIENYVEVYFPKHRILYMR